MGPEPSSPSRGPVASSPIDRERLVTLLPRANRLARERIDARDIPWLEAAMAAFADWPNLGADDLEGLAIDRGAGGERRVALMLRVRQRDGTPATIRAAGPLADPGAAQGVALDLLARACAVTFLSASRRRTVAALDGPVLVFRHGPLSIEVPRGAVSGLAAAQPPGLLSPVQEEEVRRRCRSEILQRLGTSGRTARWAALPVQDRIEVVAIAAVLLGLGVASIGPDETPAFAEE